MSATPTPGLSPAPSIWAYAITCFLSAFLLFQVQPLLGKFILPWFGGGPGVWTTAMLFFQAVLVGGYLYAHLMETAVATRAPRARMPIHLAVCVLALLCLPIIPSARFRPVGSEQPAWRILALLLTTVGLPYFLLSSTGPLTQAWFGRAHAGRSPYRLYALSNLGSVLGLLTYPVLVEPLLAVSAQARLWSIGLLLMVPLWLYCAARAGSPAALPAAAEPDATAAPPSRSDRLVFLGLPAAASVALLATTNHVCQDVAVIPFLWIAPLVLYLLSFIICFDRPAWYRRDLFCLGALLLLCALLVSEHVEELWGHRVGNYAYVRNLLLCLGALFCTCMICHGEVVRRRPPPRYLTSFYLRISIGGAVGGLLVAVLSPLLIPRQAEWYLALLGSYLIALITLQAGGTRRQRLLRLLPPALSLAAIGLAILWPRKSYESRVLTSVRNFYGEIQVIERAASDPEEHDYVLYHGGIIHGVQYQHPKFRRDAVTYYDEASGVGLALMHYAKREHLRVGLVGLGTGTLTAYATPGSQFRIYEINPAVARIARSHFHYLQDCRGAVDIVLGDARLSLEREESQQFDVLALDAFSGDAIPTHLLTREAMVLYLRHLKPDGTLAVHITNRYIDLAPVTLGLAEQFAMAIVRIQSPQDDSHEIYASDWVLLTRNAELLATLSSQKSSMDRVPRVMWTDEYSNLFRLLKR